MTRLILAAAILLSALTFLITHRVRPAEVQITPAAHPIAKSNRVFLPCPLTPKQIPIDKRSEA